MAKAISTYLPICKEHVVHIALVEVEYKVPTIDFHIKGNLVQRNLVDGGAQVCIMTESMMTQLGL